MTQSGTSTSCFSSTHLIIMPGNPINKTYKIIIRRNYNYRTSIEVEEEKAKGSGSLCFFCLRWLPKESGKKGTMAAESVLYITDTMERTLLRSIYLSRQRELQKNNEMDSLIFLPLLLLFCFCCVSPSLWWMGPAKQFSLIEGKWWRWSDSLMPGCDENEE